MFIRVLAGLFGSPVTLEFPQESTPAKPLRPVSYKALSNIRLRPPTQEAMEAAMKFLLASIAEENAGEAESGINQAQKERLSYELSVNAFETAVKAFQTWYPPTLAGLKRERNSMVSKAHDLPNEILVGIFLQVRDIGEIDRDPAFLRTLAQVCDRWRLVVLGTSQLWSRISSCYSLRTAQVFIRRSGTMPLTVVLSSAGGVEFFRAIIPSSTRWRAVKWQGEFDDHTTTILSRIPPGVMDLSITRPSSPVQAVLPWNQQRLVRFEGKAPFKHVTLRGVHVKWDTPRLSHLSTLSLAELALDWPSARSLIVASPDLETLLLQNITKPLVHMHRNYGTQTDFPTLSKLLVKNVSSDLVSYLFGTLSIPNAQSVFIDHIPRNILSESSLPLLRSLFQFMSDSPEITLSVRSRGKTTGEVTIGNVEPHTASSWIQEQDTPGFHMSFSCVQGDNLMDLLTQASAFLASSGVTSPVVLDVGSPYHRSGTKPGQLVVPKEVLANLRRACRIVVREEFNAQAVVDALATTKACPDLESLDHWTDVDMTKLLEQRGGTVGAGIWRR